MVAVPPTTCARRYFCKISPNCGASIFRSTTTRVVSTRLSDPTLYRAHNMLLLRRRIFAARNTALRSILATLSVFCSKVHSQKTCNYDNYDHDADDVENVHCVLRLT